MPTLGAAKPRGGFSILEAIVAMGVVGIVVVSLYAALTQGFGGVEMGREDMRAPQWKSSFTQPKRI